MLKQQTYRSLAGTSIVKGCFLQNHTRAQIFHTDLLQKPERLMDGLLDSRSKAHLALAGLLLSPG